MVGSYSLVLPTFGATQQTQRIVGIEHMYCYLLVYLELYSLYSTLNPYSIILGKLLHSNTQTRFPLCVYRVQRLVLCKRSLKAHPDEGQNGSTKAFAHRSCRHMPQVRASKNASLSLHEREARDPTGLIFCFTFVKLSEAIWRLGVLFKVIIAFVNYLYECFIN